MHGVVREVTDKVLLTESTNSQHIHILTDHTKF